MTFKVILFFSEMLYPILALLNNCSVYLKFNLNYSNNKMYQYIINNFCVGTWFQTLLFYSMLFIGLHIILVQLNLSFIKMRIGFLQRRVVGVDEE